MLDVSIRVEVLNVMTDLRDKLGLSFLFITHVLALAKHVTDKLGIMYLGQIVEEGAQLGRSNRQAVPSGHPGPDSRNSRA